MVLDMIEAVLFDLDGVLIETELQTFKFYQSYLKDHGIELKDADFIYKAGRKSVDFWKDVLTEEQQKTINTSEITRLKREKFNTAPDQFIGRVAGGVELLELLQRHKYKMALASQNERRMIETAVNWLNVKKYFSEILSIEEIKNLKPSPEIYLLAAKRLGVKPNNCIVIEDSKDGVNAAKNAGMACIGLQHSYTPIDALSRADIVVNTLNDVTIDLVSNFKK